MFGEDVAAAVILKQPAPDANEIRRFASERLSAFKVPGTLLIVRDIPKGPTGKVQRKRLAVLFADKLARFEQFPTPVSKSFRAPRSQRSKPTSRP